MKYIHGQILCSVLQVIRCHAEIVSGHYKTRNVSVGVAKEDEAKHSNLIDSPGKVFKMRPLTDEEKLQTSMDTLSRHIHNVYEMIERLEE